MSREDLRQAFCNRSNIHPEKSQNIRRQEDQGLSFSFAAINACKMIVAATEGDWESIGPTALEEVRRRGQKIFISSVGSNVESGRKAAYVTFRKS